MMLTIIDNPPRRKEPGWRHAVLIRACVLQYRECADGEVRKMWRTISLSPGHLQTTAGLLYTSMTLYLGEAV